jgi:glycosyltransferase involved in cell wall biosynthesis
VAKVIRVVRKFSPDVIFSNTTAIASGAIGALLVGVPHVWHVHENCETFGIRYLVPENQVRWGLAALSSRIIFVSRSALRSFFPEGHDKAVVIWNGVEASCINSPANANSGATSNGSRFAYFGSLSERKGTDVLVRAMGRLAAAGRRLHLDIWSSDSGDFYEQMLALGQKLGIATRLHFRGWCENVTASLAQYTAIIVPSRAETFSLVAAETLVAGVPLVATRCGGPEDYIEHGKHALLVPPGDDAALAAAMERIVDNPPEARLMAERGRIMAQRDLALSAQVGAIITEIELIVAKKG